MNTPGACLDIYVKPIGVYEACMNAPSTSLVYVHGPSDSYLCGLPGCPELLWGANLFLERLRGKSGCMKSYCRIPGCLKCFSKIPDCLKCFSKIPGCLKCFCKIPGCLKSFCKIPGCLKSFCKICFCLKSFCKIPGCLIPGCLKSCKIYLAA